MAMATLRDATLRTTPHRPIGLDNGIHVLIAIAAVPTLLAALLLPSTVVLPAASLLSLAAAFGVALFAFRNHVPTRGKKITYWDLAGVLALFGFATGMLADSNHLIEFFGLNATKG